MKIVFRLNYHTQLGQSLWIKYSVVLDHVRIDQEAALHWINDNQWETTLEFRGSGMFRIEYHYQMRQQSNGVQLDEGRPNRVVDVDLDARDHLLLLDDWRSAGIPDYAYQSKALRVVVPPRTTFAKLKVPDDANHLFELRMAGVPEGKVPAILGSVREIGEWGWHSAVPMVETAPDVWQCGVYLPAGWNVEYKYALYDAKLACVTSVENGDNRRLPPREYGKKPFVRVSDEGYRRAPETLFKGAGVAVPVFSLRSDDGLGVGEFADLKPFADWAAASGLKLIQILPINDTISSHNWTDSYPYSAISVFALHPLYLRIDDLGYAMPDDFKSKHASEKKRLNALPEVSYDEVMSAKFGLTRMIFKKHRATITSSALFKDFLAANEDWVVPYAVFCVKRDMYRTADFARWDEWAVYDDEIVRGCADPGHPDWNDVSFYIWLQAELDKQLIDATRHLQQHGIALKGDLPIGIDRQSVEAWSAPHLFHMSAQAGAPPDAFAVKGQNWGFPTYNWEAMRGDDYAWWRSRFEKLSRYFDAYRIDHILGFFRIWQVPYDQVEGIMGWFDPAMPIHVDEIRSRGINFDYNRYCNPHLTGQFLTETFGDKAWHVKEAYLAPLGDDRYRMKQAFSTQRAIENHFSTQQPDSFLKEGLMDCLSNVLFFEVPGSHGTLFHPRCSMQDTNSFKDLDAFTRWRLTELYNDYFFNRQENFWQAEGYKKLPAMCQASDMLLCGEDLGMVPACVPGVLKELGILSLEIQRMPKISGIEFVEPDQVPYMSVVSPSTHDMPTLRSWWKEDPRLTARFAQKMFGIYSPGEDLSGEIAMRILYQHLQFPAMWAIFPIQELLAIDEKLRYPDPDAERINVPAIMPYYWRYRMHLGINQLAKAKDFNATLKNMVGGSGR